MATACTPEMGTQQPPPPGSQCCQGQAKPSHGGRWHVALAIAEPHEATLSHARPIRTEARPRRAGLCQAPLCRRRAWGTCPLLPVEGRRGRRPPGTGAHPRAGHSLRLGGRQLGLPRQAAGNGPGATGCGAAPAAAEQARPAGQAAAAPETGSRAAPTARDAGAGAERPWPPPPPHATSPSCHRPGSPLPAGAGASGLGAIKPSGPGSQQAATAPGGIRQD